jgi:hypothetical protein
MDENEEAALRISNNPKLSIGEKMRLIARITGAPFHPAGPGYKELRDRSVGTQSRSKYLGRRA